MAKRMCVHCGVKPVGRPRQLCWACWHNPKIRNLYTPQPVGSN